MNGLLNPANPASPLNPINPISPLNPTRSHHHHHTDTSAIVAVQDSVVAYFDGIQKIKEHYTKQFGELLDNPPWRCVNGDVVKPIPEILT